MRIARERRGLRAGQAQNWLVRRADTPTGRLALQWFRAYFDASRNSGCAATIYSSLSVFPAALVIVACSHPASGDANIFAHRLVTHLRLTDATATLVEGTFGTTSANALAASLTVAISALLWGIGIGQIYQDVYARSWGIKVGSFADQGLYGIFFFILTGAVAVALIAVDQFHAARLIVLVPAWLIASTGFWLFVPRILLHGAVAYRALLPGALLASTAIGGLIGTSPLWVSAPLNKNGTTFGSLGVVLTIIAFVFVIITTSLVCAVFAPVWARWRETERARRLARGDRDAGARAEQIGAGLEQRDRGLEGVDPA